MQDKSKYPDIKPIPNDPKVLCYPPFAENELVVIYRKPPTDSLKAKVKENILKYFPRLTIDKVGPLRKCSDFCPDQEIELWRVEGIQTIIQDPESRLPGARPSCKGHGEDEDAYYYLNFVNQIPDSLDLQLDLKPEEPYEIDTAGKQEIIIAVLDTGIDPVLINNSFLWTNPEEIGSQPPPGPDCYPGDLHGWNFVDRRADAKDDHSGKHGTLVAKYIIDQFTATAPNSVRIMNLKTHDHVGNGTLFDIICALRYAKRNGAHIINASWGFYYYEEETPSYLAYLEKLITEDLKETWFFAAAGNRLREADNGALSNGIPSASLRDLSYHRFYPACLSDRSNNVITVTTLRGDFSHPDLVSPTQNRSNQYVDLGVVSDEKERHSDDVPYNFRYVFKIPFNTHPGFVSGSSFATPKAAGKVGAFLPLGEFEGQDKRLLLKYLMETEPEGKPVIDQRPNLRREAVRHGLFVVKD